MVAHDEVLGLPHRDRGQKLKIFILKSVHIHFEKIESNQIFLSEIL